MMIKMATCRNRGASVATHCLKLVWAVFLLIGLGFIDFKLVSFLVFNKDKAHLILGYRSNMYKEELLHNYRDMNPT